MFRGSGKVGEDRPPGALRDSTRRGTVRGPQSFWRYCASDRRNPEALALRSSISRPARSSWDLEEVISVDTW